jgi:TolA-binding protein
MKTEEKSTTRVEKQTTRLECIISDPEKLNYSELLTQHITGKKESEDNLKSFKSQMKSEIDGHEAAINLLSNKISTGKEYRPVDIEIHFDYNTRMKTYIRTDTGQVFKSEQMREEELQLHLELEEKRLEGLE